MNHIENQNGSIVIVAVMLLAVVSAIGILANKNTMIELEITKAEREYQYYQLNADTGLTYAAADFKNLFTTEAYNRFFDTEAPEEIDAKYFRTYYEESGRRLAVLEFRMICREMRPLPESEIVNSAVNRLYPQAHVGPPGEGQGAEIVSRRVGITATALDYQENPTGIWVQGAKEIPVEKETVQHLFGL